jgi:hypothetical protein
MITPHDRRGYNQLATHDSMGSIRMLALFGEEVLFAAKLCRERENATIVSFSG